MLLRDAVVKVRGEASVAYRWSMLINYNGIELIDIIVINGVVIDVTIDVVVVDMRVT